MILIIILLGCILSILSAKIITLTNSNFVAINTRIDDRSASEFINSITKITDNYIYIYLSTGGGRIKSGEDMIQVMETLADSGKNVMCIADTAYSMGFIIFEMCPIRYITKNSKIMQHQMTLGVTGQLERVKNYINFVSTIENVHTERQADRLQLTVDEFNQKTNNDWWLYGEDIIKTNAADEFVSVLCEPHLVDEYYNTTVRSIFGNVIIEFSKCPLIKNPKKIYYPYIYYKSMDKSMDENITEEQIYNMIKGYDIIESASRYSYII